MLNLFTKLERISAMTKDEAKQALINTLEDEVRLSTQKWVQKVEEDARQIAKEKSVQIVGNRNATLYC